MTLTPNSCRSAKDLDWWAIHRLFIDIGKLFFQVHATESWIKSINDHLAGDCSRFIIPQTCLVASALTCRRQGTSRAPRLLKANRDKGSAATSLMIFLLLAVTVGRPYNFRERFAVSHVKSQHISLPPRCSILCNLLPLSHPPTMNTTDVPAQSGITCTPEQYNTSLSDPLIHCLTRGDTIGLTVRATISM